MMDQNEWNKCRDYPTYFISRYLTLHSTHKGTVPFILYPFQIHLINTYHHRERVVVCSSRQMGITNCNLSFLLWSALFHDHQTIVLGCLNLAQTTVLMMRLDDLHKSLPEELRLTAIRHHQNVIQFRNGSVIYGTGFNKFPRGIGRCDLICMNDLAFASFSSDVDFYGNAMAATSENGKILISSSSPPSRNLFNRVWEEAVDGQDHHINRYTAIRIPWWHHPELDDDWANTIKNHIGPEFFSREYEALI